MITIKSIQILKGTPSNKYNSSSIEIGDLNKLKYCIEVLNHEATSKVTKDITGKLKGNLKDLIGDLQSLEFVYERYDFFSPDGLSFTINLLKSNGISTVYVNKIKTENSKRECASLKIELKGKKKTEKVVDYEKILNGFIDIIGD